MGLQGDGEGGANEVNRFKKYLGSKINYTTEILEIIYVKLFLGKLIYFLCWKDGFKAAIYCQW